jgi:chemotaxis family two-component system sensor kinase Cph1
MKKDKKIAGDSDLRRHAERKLKTMPKASEDLSKMSSQDLANLIHELRVHQIELEMQNEELRRIQEELEKSRDRYSQLFDFAPVGYFSVDEKGTVVAANLTAAALLGIQRASLVGRPFSRFIFREDEDVYYLQRKHLLETGNMQPFELRLVKGDGSHFDASLECLLVEDGGRDFEQIRIAVSDISARKQAEEKEKLAMLQLAEQLAETKQLNEELYEFAYAITHDLKAPLRAITNYANFLYEDLADALTGDQKEYLKGLKKAASQGDTLIDDLLSFSRIGQVTSEPEVVDLPALVKEIGSLLNLPPDVKIEVQPQWPEICVDHILMKQILQNLISNSIKFNKRNPKRIKIGWQPATDRCIEVYVRDNGIGIAPEYQQQIFAIFRRLHTDKEYEGTGIGLAIVQKAAQNMGGSVRVESTPGEGSTFFINLKNAILKSENHKSASDG